MPQGSLFAEMELNTLRITLRMNRVHKATVVTLIGENRAGGVLASGAVALRTLDECELIPGALSVAGMGYLTAGAAEAVLAPLGWLRAERGKLAERS